MQANEQTLQQIDRFLRKVAEKMPLTNDDLRMTDIHLRLSQDSGDLMAYDDEDNEITRCVIEQWIDNKDENFYNAAASIIRQRIQRNAKEMEALGVMKPYSFVLENDDKEALTELFLVDDDTVILGGDLMEGLDDDLNKFLDKLLAD